MRDKKIMIKRIAEFKIYQSSCRHSMSLQIDNAENFNRMSHVMNQNGSVDIIIIYLSLIIDKHLTESNTIEFVINVHSYCLYQTRYIA